MPGEKTIYRKIQVVLDYVKSGKHHSFDSLSKYIYSRAPANFIYYYRHKETDKVKFDYSKKSIDRTIQLCLELRLISKDRLSLANIGASASDPRRFPIIIGKCVIDLLKRKKISLDLIKNTIEDVLHDSNPKPPTSLEIWKRLEVDENDIKLVRYKQLINLLGQCNILLMTQKRIFLPFRK